MVHFLLYMYPPFGRALSLSGQFYDLGTIISEWALKRSFRFLRFPGPRNPCFQDLPKPQKGPISDSNMSLSLVLHCFAQKSDKRYSLFWPVAKACVLDERIHLGYFLNLKKQLFRRWKMTPKKRPIFVKKGHFSSLLRIMRWYIQYLMHFNWNQQKW